MSPLHSAVNYGPRNNSFQAQELPRYVPLNIKGAYRTNTTRTNCFNYYKKPEIPPRQ